MKDQNKSAVARQTTGVLSVENRKSNQSNELKHRYNLHKDCLKVRSVNVTSDNRYLIITFEDSPKIRILDLEKLSYLPNEYSGHTQTVRLTSHSRDNKSFFTASWDGTYRRFEIDSGSCTKLLCGIARSPSCFLDPEGKYLFTANYVSDYKLDAKNAGWCWDLSTGKTMNSYTHTMERVSHEAIDIAYDSFGVYTGSDDGRAYRWALFGKMPLLEYFAFQGTVRKVAISSTLFAAACTDGFIRVHKKISGDNVFNLPHPDSDLREVRISKDETKLWGASGTGFIVCYSLLNGEIIYNKRIHASWIWSLCLMRNEQILVSGGGDGVITFLSADTGEILTRFFNLESKEDILISCPPDEAFPSGFFYTTNKEYINIFQEEVDEEFRIILNKDNPRYNSYFSKHNLKNLVISCLKNNKQYNELISNYLEDHRFLLEAKQNPATKMLRA